MSTIEKRSCLRGDIIRTDSLLIGEAEIRRTEFKYPYLAKWRPTPNDPAGESAWAVATNLLVKFRSDISAESARSLLREALDRSNLTIPLELRPMSLKNLFLAHAPSDFPGLTREGPTSYLLAAMPIIEQNPEVLRATPDFLQFSFSLPSDSSYAPNPPVTPDLNRLGILSAWEKIKGSRRIRVAVLDTGVAASHRALKDNILSHNGCVIGYNFYADNSNSEDDNKHGTFCAGLIGGTMGIGVNQQVSILPIKFLGSSGCGCLSDAIEGIEFAIRHGARVISNSWGSLSYSPDLEEKIAEAGFFGILFVAGAGNEDRNLDQTPHFFPASYLLPNVISVGATNDDDTAVLIWGHGQCRVHLSAPGVTISSSVLGNGFGEDNGTSASTAYVAGACALLMAEFPKWNSRRIRQRLLAFTTPLAKPPDYPASCTNRKLDLANAVFARQSYPVGDC
jgi:subtilisin family serine protease